MNKRKLRVAHGNSLLYGNNYGPYPKRVTYNFSALGKMRPRVPLAFSSYSTEEWHKQVYRERVNSDTYSIELVADGVFNYTLDGKSYRVSPGEIFFVQLGKNSAMCTETETAVKKTVIIEGSALQHTLEYLELDTLSIFKPLNLERITAIMDNFVTLGERATFDNFRSASVEAYRLLLEISAQNKEMRRPAELQRAIEFIHENLDKNLVLQDIVNSSQASGATLHRQFRKYLNVSPVEYFINAKMEMAHGLLLGSTLSIKEIASRLNYSSQQYFASEFKKRYGKTPGESRNR
ncbi:MAG: helix-turn-helix transcriptional regulator [Lentisphaeria bacterium]|nr:helix-turn-helix transcriptional regulator [Lentisphaeria bacterium]